MLQLGVAAGGQRLDYNLQPGPGRAGRLKDSMQHIGKQYNISHVFAFVFEEPLVRNQYYGHFLTAGVALAVKCYLEQVIVPLCKGFSFPALLEPQTVQMEEGCGPVTVQ